MGCAKYRINHLDFGNLPGTNLPRLLDMGQCNDSYGARPLLTVPIQQYLLQLHTR